MEAKEMVPVLRFKEFKTPWKNILFKDICSDFSYGIGASAKEYDGSNKYLRITDIDEESNRFLPNPLTSPDGEIEDKYILKTGDIVFARTGASVGKSYLYNEKDGNLIFAGFLIKATIKDGVPEFVFQSTLTKKYKNWVHVFSMRSGQPGINAQEYSSYKLSLPKIEEQQKIASFLSSVDDKISQLEKKKTLLETYKRGIMQKIFSQELRFKDENGQEFPKWKYLPLGKMTNIKSSKRVLKEDWKNEGIPFYRTREIISLSNKESFNTPTFIDEKLYEELKINYGVPTVNDILVTGVGTIGITYLVEDNKPFYFKDGNVILVESSDSLDSQFIKYCYQTRHVKKQLSDNASITTVATYTIDNARKTIIPVPLITEQQKIASFLSSIDKKIEITSTQLDKTRKFKKGLLQQMFV